MKLVFALVLLLASLSLACYTVNVCSDIGSGCSKIESGAAAVLSINNAEEEVLLAYSEEVETLSKNKKIKVETKGFSSGNIVLSDGSCVTSCAWFGLEESKTQAICSSCAKRFLTYTPPSPGNCYALPDAINNGSIPMQDVNIIKQACATLGACTCKPGDIVKTEKVVLLYQALASEVSIVIQVLKAKTAELKANFTAIEEMLKSLKTKAANNEAATCVAKVEEAYKNVTRKFEETLKSLENTKQDFAKMIEKADAKPGDMTEEQFAKILNKILKLRKKFTKKFAKKIHEVKYWTKQCAKTAKELKKEDEARIRRSRRRAQKKAEKKAKKEQKKKK